MHPDQYTIKEHHYQTEDKLHTLYVQEWGSPNGKPVLYVHGGPGSGCSDKHKLLFDPSIHRVIFVDQRGSGRSTPQGSLEHNTTPHLVQDLEMIRIKLNIDRWTLYGNSWGSTLSLCYAIAHHKHVNSLVIAGIWLGSKEEEDWLYNGGWRYNFPELWQTYLSQTPAEYHEKPGAYHISQLSSHNHIERKKSLFAFMNVQYSLVHFDEKKLPLDITDFDEDATVIEMHYSSHSDFMAENYILDNAHKLTMPVYIIQSRYDMVCTPKAAVQLHDALPNSQLTMALAGHTLSRGNADIIAQTLALL